MKKSTATIACSLGAVLLVGATVRAEEKLVLDGSTTVGPVAKAFAEYYMAQNPDVNVTVSELVPTMLQELRPLE